MAIKLERIGVRVTPHIKNILDEICKKDSRSISNLVNMVIEKYLEKNE